MKAIAEKLRASYASIQNKDVAAPQCFIGFDGFTDEIIQVVQERKSQSEYLPFTKMCVFGEQIIAAANKSRNFELVVRQKKLGGNAAILANALLQGGHHIAFAGTIGKPGAVEPLFKEMADRCQEVFCLAPSAHTDALEFLDGKLILGKLDNLKEVDWIGLLSQIGPHKLLSLLEKSDLTAFGNWTMTLEMTTIWQKIAQEIAPLFKTQKKRWLFIDLADPAKRTKADLKAALEALRQLSNTYTVVLGLNESEAQQVKDALELSQSEDLLEGAAQIKARSGLQYIVIHTTKYAFGANEWGNWSVPGRYIAAPLISTGAGDHFNAGLCHGLLYGLSLQESLLSGVASSGYYIAHGKSPTIDQLASYLER